MPRSSARQVRLRADPGDPEPNVVTYRAHQIHVSLPRPTATVIAVTACLLASACATSGPEKAGLDAVLDTAKAEKTRLASAPAAARMPEERYSDPLVVAAAGDGVEPVQGSMSPIAATEGLVPVAQESAAANLTPTPEGPTNLQELVMQPTAANAGNGSIFTSQQTAYAPEASTMGEAGSTSLVPANLPPRAGINPASSSLFSAPRPAETYPSYAAAEPEPMAEQLVTPEPAPAYDPAEPLPATEATTEPKGKSFSLMRILGRKGG